MSQFDPALFDGALFSTGAGGGAHTLAAAGVFAGVPALA